MIAVYTYWTNEGKDYSCGFHRVDAFVDIAKKSISKAKKYFEKVFIYTDSEGKEFLEKNGFKEEFVVIDYSEYQFNKLIWNFPKLLTYSLQEKAFLHLDFDVILESKPKNLDNELVCEMIRPEQPTLSNYRKFLPEPIQKNYNPYLPCSGILGGTNLKLFKKLFEISYPLCSNISKDVDDKYRYTIEEVVLASICKANKIKPTEIDCKFKHYQGSSEKLKLSSNIKDKDLLL